MSELTREKLEALLEHTPGPWTVPHFAAEPGLHGDCKCGYVFAGEDCRSVCTVHVHDAKDEYDQNPEEPQANANARLIAAAPDILQTALAYLDRAERAEAERDDNQAIYNMYFQDIGKAIGDNRKRRWTGEPSQSDAREIRDMKAEREALKDVLRELVEAVRSCDTMRVASAIARAEDALNT